MTNHDNTSKWDYKVVAMSKKSISAHRMTWRMGINYVRNPPSTLKLRQKSAASFARLNLCIQFAAVVMEPRSDLNHDALIFIDWIW